MTLDILAREIHKLFETFLLRNALSYMNMEIEQEKALVERAKLT